MAGSVNKVILVGNLGADPEIRYTKDGKAIALLRVATSERWRDREGNRQEKTEWHRVVIFSEGLTKVAENYLRKGSKVYIEGQLQTREWEDQNQQRRFTTEVVLQGFNSTLTMLDTRSMGDHDSHSIASDKGARPGVNNQPERDNDRHNTTANILDDDIPF